MNIIIRSISLLATFCLSCCVIAPLPFTSDKSPQFKGKVVDSNSRRPIAGAKIWTEGNERRKVMSDQPGEFLLNPSKNLHLILYLNPSFGFGLPQGSYTNILKIEAKGYKPLVLDFTSAVIRDQHIESETNKGYRNGPFYHEYFTLKPLSMQRQE